MSNYQIYLEPVIEEFTTGEYYREVFNAKQEFFDKAGVVYEDDADFEQRMCIFMDWYLYDRDLPGVDLPPMKYYFRKNKDSWDAENTLIYKELCNTIHSIFQLKRHQFLGSGFVVEDLFSSKTYTVNDLQINRGFSRGDIFEGRLIPYEGRYEFSRGFCFHPVEMGSFILSEIKKVRFQEKGKHTKLILQLSNMKLKHQRFQHIDVKHIYRFDSKF